MSDWVFLSLSSKISYILARLLKGGVDEEGRKFNSLVTRVGLRGHSKSGRKELTGAGTGFLSGIQIERGCTGAWEEKAQGT